MAEELIHGRRHLFHLAIPAANLDESADFYTRLGCRIARRYDDRITLDFFGDQVVCHLAPDKIDPAPQMYPRHFGTTFLREAEFRALLTRVRVMGLPFFQPVFVRFAGKRETHETFVLIDPANNLIEFKWYQDPEMAY